MCITKLIIALCMIHKTKACKMIYNLTQSEFVYVIIFKKKKTRWNPFVCLQFLSCWIDWKSWRFLFIYFFSFFSQTLLFFGVCHGVGLGKSHAECWPVGCSCRGRDWICPWLLQGEFKISFWTLSNFWTNNNNLLFLWPVINQNWYRKTNTLLCNFLSFFYAWKHLKFLSLNFSTIFSHKNLVFSK